LFHWIHALNKNVVSLHPDCLAHRNMCA
jgi:hypothetical protein